MRVILQRLVPLLFVLVFLSAEGGLAAYPAFRLNVPFTHYAENQELSAVLMSFARAQGLAGVVSPEIGGTISGRFVKVPPAEFLGGLQAAYGVAWYVRGGELHFYSEKESTEAFIAPKTMDGAGLFRMLSQSGLFSPQLPPRLAGGLIRVFGPPEYVQRIVSAARALEAVQSANIVMRVFPLKYAWADDITIQSMDKNVIIPGIASILRAMLTGQGGEDGGHRGGAPVVAVSQEPAVVDKLNGTGLIARGKEGGQGGEQNTTNAPGLPSGVNIIADSRVNAVVISDSAYRMPYYEQVIRDLDKSVQLVEIHAAIVDIDVESGRELGVSYQGGYVPKKGWGVGGELAPGAGTFKPVPTPGTTTTTGLSLSTIYTHGADYFLARVSALESEGNARVLGRPSVLTVDNVQASLENTTTYYVMVEGYQATDLYKVEAGTVLRVTPHIIREKDGRTVIKLAVNVQDAQSNDTQQVSPAGSAPQPIKQTTINTQAVVGAGESLLIGGYYYEKRSKDVSGIPVLMHIPVLGHLFKTTSEGTKRMERLILITPKVIGLGDLPKVPEHVDEPSFHQSPVQADYEERLPVEPSPGCSRRSSAAPAFAPAPAGGAVPSGATEGDRP